MTYTDLRPDHVRTVQVLVDGRWRDGDLVAYRRDGDGWLGGARWSVEPGAQHVGWYGEGAIRPN